ncbi:MAG: hypothetical protein JWO36_6290 [Myxococcales bacterium]|nr:hypothetical protein [Myxococcales bacterium]
MSSRRNHAFLLHRSIFAVVLAGCGSNGSAPCTADGECPSHFCKADGTCGPAPTDAAPQADAVDGNTSGVCTPNHDGMISLPELPLIAGRMATFRVATNATWSTAGQANMDGTRTWDLTGQLSGDGDHPITLASPAGAWWAPDFATATYAASLSSSSTLLGVFNVSASGVTLLGVVSPAAGNTKTELTYDPPARILALPFGNGATWNTTSTVSGYAQGFISSYTESYQSRVDQVGTMKTPYGDFPVLRVATDLTRTSGFTTLLTKRSFAWIAECFGSVATVQSQDFGSGAEFSDDAEVRRLAP